MLDFLKKFFSPIEENDDNWDKNKNQPVPTPAVVEPTPIAKPKLQEFVSNGKHRPLERPVTCLVIGAGSRGLTYAWFAERFPKELQVVGVADTNKKKADYLAKRFGATLENTFYTWEEALKKPKFADFAIIATPDHLHFAPAIKALKQGYDLLLEKPIAQSWKECQAILAQAQKSQRMVAVAHVLRYTPYFKKVKEIVESGVLGEIISVQHLEPIEHIHMSHSYVRGIWHKAEETNPIILAKSSHDMDILRWLIGKNCIRLSSFGSLKWFRPQNAPEGSTTRCSDGCAVEATCPYSALRIYHRERSWLYHFDLPEQEPARGEAILDLLRTSNYGKCVYHADNNVCDHQIVAMEFEEGITATFNMEAHTSYQGRRTRIMGSKGDLVGDETIIQLSDFSTKKTQTIQISDIAEVVSGHGGGDHAMMRDLVQAVGHQDPSLLSSSIEMSLESHRMAFKAEESRIKGSVVQL